MDRAHIDGILTTAEAALASSGKVDLGSLGFWKAVNAVKKQPEMVEVFADRIGRVDREAFERWALLKIPPILGTALAMAVTIAGLILIVWADRLAGSSRGVALVVGTALVVPPTHGLAHWATATLFGIRVSHWFVGTARQPQPGIKVDYATYLRVPARKRAWMHASGAIVTKVIPFVSLLLGLRMGAPTWALIILGVQGVVQIMTDVLWSTKASDWKKFNREMALTRVG